MLTALLALLVVAQDPQTPRFAGYPEQDAISYELELAVDPGRMHLQGTVHYRFAAVQALDSIRLDSTPGEGWAIAFFTGTGPAVCTAEEGRDSLRMVQGTYESNAGGKRISLDFD